MEFLVLALACLLAFANGANDNAKGVATLVGYGAAGPTPALAWAAITTGLGALIGTLAGSGLLVAFRAGFVGHGEPLPAPFFAATLAGACAWVLFATRTGLPVSTTHAILGGLVGAGLVEVGVAGIGWTALAAKAAIPLLLSPLVALGLVYLAARPLAALARRSAARCICAVPIAAPTTTAGVAGALSLARPSLAIVTGEATACAVHGAAALATGTGVATAVHWGTSGLVGFARGWNDTPKIAALAIVALPATADTGFAFGLVAAAMAGGGLLAARRVLRTLAEKITPLPLGESLAASGVSSVLVGLASWLALPVSTTHVTTGGIIGAGLARDARGVRWTVVREVVLAWVVTLPAAALLALLARALLAAL